MTAWHIAPELMQRYAEGTIDVAHAFSVEAHLEACDACRGLIVSSVDERRLVRMWAGVQASVASPQKGLVERFLMLLGVKEHVSRLLAATPALRLSWFLALGVVLAIAVGVSRGSLNGYAFFLVVAPLLPVAGVAASYGSGIDPTYEIGLASPMRSLGLLLIRAIAVLVSTTLIAGFAALFLPTVDWRTAAWILPSLGLVTATLALSTVVRPPWAAGIVTVAWVAVATAAGQIAMGEASARDVFGESMQTGSLIVTVVALLILVLRHDRFERSESL